MKMLSDFERCYSCGQCYNVYVCLLVLVFSFIIIQMSVHPNHLGDGTICLSTILSVNITNKSQCPCWNIPQPRSGFSVGHSENCFPLELHINNYVNIQFHFSLFYQIYFIYIKNTFKYIYELDQSIYIFHRISYQIL